MRHSLEEAPSADAPWMRQKDWACGRIRSGGVAGLVLWWVVAGVWNGFVLIFIAVFRGNPEYNDYEQARFEILSMTGTIRLF